MGFLQLLILHVFMCAINSMLLGRVSGMFLNVSFWFVFAEPIQSVVRGVWDLVLSSGTVVVKSKSMTSVF